MANQKISQLTEKTTLDWGEEIPFAENGENGKLKTSTLKAQILPNQTGNSGKFLKTNGTGTSRDNIPAELPDQTGNSGKFLKTDGTNPSWETVDALPGQTGQSGKFLKTNGTTASRENIPTELPSQTGQAGKVLTTNGTEASRETPTGGISTLSGSPIDLKYKWNGSKAQFEALSTYRADTEYNVIG